MKMRALLIPVCLLTAGLMSACSDCDNSWPVLKGPFLGQTPPGEEPEVFAPGLISTDDEYEINSIFSKDGREFYYVISASTPEEKSRGIYEYYVKTSRLMNGQWTRPEKWDVANGCNAVDIAFSPDGNRFYFCSDLPSQWENPDGYDIWYVERQGEGWSEPVNAGPNINSAYGETQPTFTAEGHMVFPSRRPGGKGQEDIYIAEFVDGEFLPAKPIEDINSQWGEGNSFVAPDGRYILFGRWGMPESMNGGRDVCISFRKPDGRWTEPLTTRSASEIYGTLAALSPDGRYLFYSTRKGIMWVRATAVDTLETLALRQ